MTLNGSGLFAMVCEKTYAQFPNFTVAVTNIIPIGSKNNYYLWGAPCIYASGSLYRPYQRCLAGGVKSMHICPMPSSAGTLVGFCLQWQLCSPDDQLWSFWGKIQKVQSSFGAFAAILADGWVVTVVVTSGQSSIWRWQLCSEDIGSRNVQQNT